MKRREKLKVCKLTLDNINADITRFSINGNCYKIEVSMDAIIDNPNYALHICEGISNALSFDNVRIIVSFDMNILTIEYANYNSSELASLDVDSVLEGDDNVLYFKNTVNVFIKD